MLTGLFWSNVITPSQRSDTAESSLRKQVAALLRVQQESLHTFVDPRSGRFAGLTGSIKDDRGRITINAQKNGITVNFLPTITASPRRPV